MTCSHRLSIKTTVISVWVDFAIKFCLGVVSPQFAEKGGMGPLSNLVVTTCRLPVLTTGISLTVFTVLWLVTDRWNWSSKRQHYVLKCIGCQKCNKHLTGGELSLLQK